MLPKRKKKRWKKRKKLKLNKNIVFLFFLYPTSFLRMSDAAPTPDNNDNPFLSSGGVSRPNRMRAAHEALAKKRAANAIKRLMEEKARIDGLLGEGTISGEGKEIIIPPPPPPPPQEEVIPPPPPPPPERHIITPEEGEVIRQRLVDEQLLRLKDKIINENEEEKKMSSSEEIEAVPIENKPSKSKKRAIVKNKETRKKRKTPPVTASNSSDDDEPIREGKRGDKRDSRKVDARDGRGEVRMESTGSTHRRQEGEKRRDKKRRKIDTIPLDDDTDQRKHLPPTDNDGELVKQNTPLSGAMEAIGNVVNRVRDIELPPAVRTAMHDSAATCGWGVIVFAMVLLRGHFEKKYGLRTGNASYTQQFQQPQQPPQQSYQRPNMAPVPDNYARNNNPQPQTKGSQGGGLLSR
jgi:hypothetical protein